MQTSTCKEHQKCIVQNNLSVVFTIAKENSIQNIYIKCVNISKYSAISAIGPKKKATGDI